MDLLCIQMLSLITCIIFCHPPVELFTISLQTYTFLSSDLNTFGFSLSWSLPFCQLMLCESNIMLSYNLYRLPQYSWLTYIWGKMTQLGNSPSLFLLE